jgi:hypothetical protein
MWDYKASMRLGVPPFWPVVLMTFSVIGFSPLTLGQTVFVDFNTPGQYTANFNPWNDSTGVNAGNYSFSENTSAGVNGSGGVSATSWSAREQYKTATGSALETILGTNRIVAGRWYKFVVGLTNTGGTTGNYTAGCALYDYGADGLTPGTNVISFSTVRSNTGQTTITVPSLWPAFRAYQNGGVDAWDNFLVYVASSTPVFTLALTNMSLATGNPPQILRPPNPIATSLIAFSTTKECLRD